MNVDDILNARKTLKDRVREAAAVKKAEDEQKAAEAEMEKQAKYEQYEAQLVPETYAAIYERLGASEVEVADLRLEVTRKDANSPQIMFWLDGIKFRSWYSFSTSWNDGNKEETPIFQFEASGVSSQWKTVRELADLALFPQMK